MDIKPPNNTLELKILIKVSRLENLKTCKLKDISIISE